MWCIQRKGYDEYAIDKDEQTSKYKAEVFQPLLIHVWSWRVDFERANNDVKDSDEK